jgi:hypothetical protein
LLLTIPNPKSSIVNFCIPASLYTCVLLLLNVVLKITPVILETTEVVLELTKVVHAKKQFRRQSYQYFYLQLFRDDFKKKKAVVRREPPLCRSRLKNLALEEGG